nr:glycosyltransferase [Candidatus Njordarchaeum guaymaensis]
MRENREKKVSVVIPTYQEGRYLETTLSDLSKRNNSVEIIVVDGGSRDETVKIAERFARKVYQINERGISKARNYGARKSVGEILVFLDADVTPRADFVEKVIETFNDGEIVGATCNIMPAHPRLAELVFFLFYNRLIRLCSRFKPHSRGEFMAVRRKEFISVNGFNEKLPCLEDHDLAFRISRLGKFVFISDLTVYETLRRFRRIGLPKVVTTWFIDYVSLTLRGKPVSRVWHSVR